MDKITTLERKLKRVMRDVHQIQKELLFAKVRSRRRPTKNSTFTADWKDLGREVSAAWKGRPDAVEEIRWHREKP